MHPEMTPTPLWKEFGWGFPSVDCAHPVRTGMMDRRKRNETDTRERIGERFIPPP